MKKEPVASSGRCLIPAVASADEVLKSHNITMVSATAGDRTVLASGLNQVDALNGGVANFASNVKITFASRTGYSFFEALASGKNLISMNRCSSSGSGCAPNNVAHFMHELGHRAGHAQYPGARENYYSVYLRQVSKCQPTAYSRANRIEEFAEVFAAYITHPEILSGGDSACRRAFAFFSTDMFRMNGRLASCEPAAKRELLALATGSGASIQVAAVTPSPAARAQATSRPVTARQVADNRAAPPRQVADNTQRMDAVNRPAQRPAEDRRTIAQPFPVAVASAQPKVRMAAARRSSAEWYFSNAADEEEFQGEVETQVASLRGWPW